MHVNGVAFAFSFLRPNLSYYKSVHQGFNSPERPFDEHKQSGSGYSAVNRSAEILN